MTGKRKACPSGSRERYADRFSWVHEPFLPVGEGLGGCSTVLCPFPAVGSAMHRPLWSAVLFIFGPPPS